VKADSFLLKDHVEISGAQLWAVAWEGVDSINRVLIVSAQKFSSSAE